MSEEIKFSCLACGQQIVCDASESGRPMLCPACGANVTVPRLMSEETAPPVPESETPEPSVTPAPAAAVAVSTHTSALAVASLVCSLVLCVGWLPGIICGHLAKARIRRDPSLTGRGLATAGLIISYATLLFGTCLAVWLARIAYDQSQKTGLTLSTALLQAEQMMASNKITFAQAQTLSETVSNNEEQAQPAGPGWTMDVKNAQIPDSPVTGEIHGQNFALRRAIFRAGNLRFLSANGSESVAISGLGADVANNTFQVDPNSTDNSPKIEISWGENGQNHTQTFDTGYALQLKFDAAQKRKIPGHIYLCLPDDSKSYLAGDFTITLPKPKKTQADAQQ